MYTFLVNSYTYVYGLNIQSVLQSVFIYINLKNRKFIEVRAYPQHIYPLQPECLVRVYQN